MEQKDKELLLTDLCGRLPHGVYVQVVDRVGFTHTWELNPEVIQKMWTYKSIKPYLRPMSSMTGEEQNEWFNYYHEIELKEAKSTGDYLKAAILGESASIDWLNKKMFDYRGLIPKDLALSTEIYNPYKE